MSRVDDSDNQRIKEMQETELRARMDKEKKDQEVRVTKSFQEVMRDKTNREASKQLNTKVATKEGQAQKQGQKSAAQSLLARTPKTAAELSKRAALSRAMAQGLAKTRNASSDQVRDAESSRLNDLSKSAEDEKDRVDRELRDADEGDAVRTEERQAEHRKVDPDGERGGDQRTDQRKQGRGGDDKQDQRPDSVEAAEGPKPKHEVKMIPQEVLERIVGAIYSAASADGRTEMHIDLKGPMLEGVRLQVAAKDGKVTCTFVGCDKQTKNLLESSKGALMRGLSKKGLTLVNLKVA